MAKLLLNKRLSLLYRTITLLVIAVLVCQIIVYLWIQSSVKDHFKQMDSEILTHAASSIRHQKDDSHYNSYNQPTSSENNLPHYHPNQLNYDLKIVIYNLKGELLSSEPEDITSTFATNFDINSLYDKYKDSSFDLQLEGRHYRALIIRQAHQLSLLLLPIDVHHQYLNQFNYRLIWLLTIMTLVLVTVAAVSVYWGFAPLNTLGLKMRSINAKQLNERVNIEDMPIELRPLAQSYNTMMDNLEDNFDSLSRYSDHIAHELRTPLATLMTQTQVMLSQPRDVNEYKEQLHQQHDTLEQLSVLINNLLLLAKTQKRLTHTQFSRVNTDSLLQKIMSYYEFVAEEKGIEFIKNHRIADVLGNENLLQRLFANLIANATYYASEDSQIVISALPDEVQTNKPYTTIMIENSLDFDIDSADTDKLFERFYRHQSKQKRVTGTGLGLSIAKAIVHAHQGEISIDTSDKKVFKVKVSLLAVE